MPEDRTQYFQQLIEQALALRETFAFELPEEENVQITYLPLDSNVVFLGLIDTLDFMWEQRIYGTQEKSRKPRLSHSYHRVVRKDGELLRIDTFSGHNLTCTRFFLYENNTRYCFPKYYAPCQMPVLAEVVRRKDGFVEESYALTDNVLSYDRYCKQDDGTVAMESFQFWPKSAPHIRVESQGFFRKGKHVRYQETYHWTYPNKKQKPFRPLWLKNVIGILAKLLICIAILALLATPLGIIIAVFAMMAGEFWPVVSALGIGFLPALVGLLVFFRSKKRALKYWAYYMAVFILLFAVNTAYITYDNSITIDTAPTIRTYEYLPFREDSKIVHLDQEASLHLTGDLPIVDGAAAVFPVYSAFVNAVYPDTTELYDGVFEYNNTVGGYAALADKATDIFFGAYPSQEQRDYAAEQGTQFVYTPIGTEAFVFFVHKDNPIDNLTTEQIQKIYSGEITNWKEVGGLNERIAPFQRNEGSGSQSMLIRFMDGVPLTEPDTELVSGGMGGIIEQVANYRNTTASIGFSFRFYMEGMIQNPNVKLLSVDGVAPTVENIQNGTYPITTPLYAVTFEGNDNPNVEILLAWVLSEEGQLIIQKTGYVPLQ